jgi:predicted amidohydrolase
MIKLATCQYQIEKLSSFEAYVTKIEALVAQVKAEGANLLLLPEYAGIEITCARYHAERELYEAIQPLLPKYIALYQDLAQRYQIYLQPGSIIEKIAPEHYVNRAYFFSPSGVHGYQDKLQLTEFEKSIQILSPGSEQTVFATALGKIGIAICYDSEFPEVVRPLVHAGATLILVPSYTTTIVGYHRVLLSCRARAIENQCYMAVSYVVGTVDLSAGPEDTVGAAAVLGPVDINFPDDGLIGHGTMNQVGMVMTDISFEKLAAVRSHGQVHNFEDSQCYAVINKHDIKEVRL